jgi:hypothetical protein
MMEGKPEIHKRALRRYHAHRRKAWVRRTLHHYFIERHALSARRVGMYSKTPKICSCFMCGNPRRFLGELTFQERRAMLDSDLCGTGDNPILSCQEKSKEKVKSEG